MLVKSFHISQTLTRKQFRGSGPRIKKKGDEIFPIFDSVIKGWASNILSVGFKKNNDNNNRRDLLPKYFYTSSIVS